MLLQTNSYFVPKDRRMEHARLLRRFRQALARIGCDHFEVYEQVGSNWSVGESTGRFVQIMRFRDRKHQQAVQAAERSDPGAQSLIKEFCDLINFPYQQQQGLFAIGFYTSVLPVAPLRVAGDESGGGETAAGAAAGAADAGAVAATAVTEAPEVIPGAMATSSGACPTSLTGAPETDLEDAMDRLRPVDNGVATTLEPDSSSDEIFSRDDEQDVEITAEQLTADVESGATDEADEESDAEEGDATGSDQDRRAWR